MATDDDISFDRSLLGVEHHIGTFHVTEEMIVDFSISTGETSPLFLDDAAAKKNGHEGEEYQDQVQPAVALASLQDGYDQIVG